MTTRCPFLLPLFLLFLLAPPPPSASGLWLGQLKTLLSLSRSLLTRVANARATRGDLAGAARARKIADKLRLLGSGEGGGIWSLGWDFARNYAWRGGLPTAEVSRAASQLLAALVEFSRIDSPTEKARWAVRNYLNLLALSNSLLEKLLHAFSRSGPLREMVLVIQEEAAEGELIRDCLEVGAADLEGLVRIARDLFFSSNSSDDGEL
ncbi:uncharacterized protein LOC103717208 [Phoenix dactylifera]|uniref:Uncharacterized protein LOC103717208 n=1 Tax=Phoenix dactylifera TaxID=42345 RepID=A0A8B7CPS0_PHODC|nr:uncharacterized protein LOC103717208 [Phoenix dactylifera]XP_008803731.2 uncharacterized protein LOC103717208 [Phoenix dactylifera]XP_038981335.1 uncharacterized protein LOC103717208 [Phoenix dactylifera]XP_038981336.1 uncharacterized protein LOC103717208 [Phoenix dactylifera]